MAKQWISQKRLKMKVYRAKARGVMKRYSSEVISCGRSVNKEGMATLYPNKGLGVTTQDLLRYNRPLMVSEPRSAARELREKVRNGTEPLRYFRLLDDAFARARLYYHNNPDYCCIVELDRRSSVHRRSIKYNNRDIAYARYCDGSIDWSEEFYHPLILETQSPTG